MKKIIIRITLATILVSMFAFTGSVFAQAEVPPDAPLGAGTVSDEPLYLNHDEMVTALVDLTGLSAEEVEARLADGETAYNIAISQGVSPEDFYAILPMGGFRMQAAGQGGNGRFGTETAPRLQMQERAQDGTCLIDCDGTCLMDCEPQLLNLNLMDCEPQLLNLNLVDGSAASRGGRWNR
ncbi:MAG: hypothetical protein K8R77_08420 [Anaerolineaceae bacterium]|nr:hypothetical protein [Anaerolineaceae bacterium]